MQIQTVEHLSEDLPDTATPRRHPAKKVAALFAGLLTAGAVLVGAQFDAEPSDRVVPPITMSGDVAPTGVPTVPCPVDSHLAETGDSSEDR